MNPPLSNTTALIPFSMLFLQLALPTSFAASLLLPNVPLKSLSSDEADTKVIPVHHQLFEHIYSFHF